MAQVAAQVAVGIDGRDTERDEQPRLSGDTRRRLGTALRVVYDKTIDTPIPDSQVDLLLQLRHRERDLRRAG